MNDSKRLYKIRWILRGIDGSYLGSLNIISPLLMEEKIIKDKAFDIMRYLNENYNTRVDVSYSFSGWMSSEKLED